MEKKKHFFGISPRIALMLIIVGVIPVLLLLFLTFSSIETTFIDTKGKDLSDVATQTAILTKNYIKNVTLELSTFTINPAVLNAVDKADKEALLFSVAKREEGRKLNLKWKDLDNNSREVKKVLDTELSQYLRNHLTIRAIYRRLMVLDAIGRVVAASSKPSKYYFGDENWWKTAINGNLKSYIGKIKFNMDTKTYDFDIAIPVWSADNECIGMVRGVVKIDDLLDIVKPIKFGLTGEALIISEDGTIIASRDYTLKDQITYDYFSELKDKIARTTGEYYVLTNRKNKRKKIVGISKYNLNDEFPELKWNILAEQDYSEVIKPVKIIRNGVLFYFLLIIGMVIVLILWFSRELTRPFIEKDLSIENGKEENTIDEDEIVE